ncbi:DNA-binding transcriptional regulator OxyR [Sphingobacteriaceae bacterium]|nr:DNA-binding transcriptional regulator OxyR [Sphingobacteriaceae bacterium]
MNIQQFQYILAVAEHKHFELAAEKCFITQSTLSTMISKFEDEIDVQIFDRKKKPVQITNEGSVIIEQLKIITNTIEQLQELVKEVRGEIKGTVTLSVIPTVAPFLLPLFLQDFAAKFPSLTIKVREETTSEIIRKIKSRELDIGILSIPLADKDLIEIKLYDEPFVFFDAGNVVDKTVSMKKINLKNLFLMEEGHCMRTQVLQLCDISKQQIDTKLNFEYMAGSIDSLLRFVKANKATTLLPYLAVNDFSKEEKMHVGRFSSPVPYRTVGMVVHRHFVKKKLFEILQKDIMIKVSSVISKTDIVGEKLSPR